MAYYEETLLADYSTGLVAYYKLNDTGSPIVDSGSNGYNSLSIGASTPSYNQAEHIANSNINSLRTAAATNNYIAFEAVGTSNRFRLSAWTVAVWFKRMGAGSYGTSGTGTGGMNAEPLFTKGGAESETLGLNMNWGMGLLQEIDPTGATHDFYLAADFEKDDTNSATWPTGRNARMINISTSGTTITTRTDPTASSTPLTHGYSNNDRVLFGGAASPTGVTTARWYYVINASGSTFSVASTEGGSAISLSTVAAGADAWINHAKMTNGNTGITSSDQNWHFAVNTWDGTNLKCYLDGVLVENEVPTCVPPENISTELCVLSGYATSTGTVNGYFNGYLQHASVWNTAFTATQIQNLYTAGGTQVTSPTAAMVTSSPTLPPTTIVIQLSDTGSSIDDSTVVSSTLVLKRNGTTLTSGDDYGFSYNSGNDQITLRPLKSSKFQPGVYSAILSSIKNANGTAMTTQTVRVTSRDTTHGATPLGSPGDSGHIGVLGDRCGSFNAAIGAAVDSVIIQGSLGVNNLIGSGDYNETGFTYSQINGYIKGVIDGRSGVCTMGRGNHDYDGTNEDDFNGFWGIAGTNHYCYSTIGNCLVAAYNDNSEESAWNAGGYTVSAATQEAAAGGQWLKDLAANSNAAWKIAMIHRPPYSSGTGGNTTNNQMDYAAMGYDLVIQGHIHGIERLYAEGITYYTVAMAGDGHHGWITQSAESQWRETDTTVSGFLRIYDSTTDLQLEFYDTTGTRIDQFRIAKNAQAANPSWTTSLSGQSKKMNVGSNATLIVGASGADSYAWFRGNTILAETTGTLSLASLTPQDAGVYRCRALSSGGYVESTTVVTAILPTAFPVFFK